MRRQGAYVLNITNTDGGVNINWAAKGSFVEEIGAQLTGTDMSSKLGGGRNNKVYSVCCSVCCSVCYIVCCW